MSISCSIEPATISRDEYHRLDYAIMGLILAARNDLGRLCDEKIYQAEIMNRCEDAGFHVEKEVRIRVAYEDFVKTYRLDLVIGNRIIYELKTAEALTPRHEQQTLNYLFLSGLRKGKLVNLRPATIQRRFVTTEVTADERYQVEFDDAGWSHLGEDSGWLKEQVRALLDDWGSFLDIQLFTDAICFFRGGEDAYLRPVKLTNRGRVLGVQNIPLLTPDIGVDFSAIENPQPHYEGHLRRLLARTPLRAIHWINIYRRNVLMKTLVRQ